MQFHDDIPVNLKLFVSYTRQINHQKSSSTLELFKQESTNDTRVQSDVK